MRRVVFSGLILGWIAMVSSAAGAQNPGGSAEAKKMKNPVASNAASIAAGKAAFQKNCRFCHGAEAKGNGPMAPEGTHPSDLTDDKWDRGSSDGEIFVVIRDGIGPDFNMPGFKTRLSDAEIWNVVSYVKGLGGKK
jgi:cbb3-type cytochrome c oxidase subunit III